MKKIFTILLAAIAMGFLGGCSDDAGGWGGYSVSAPTGLSASAKSSTSVRLRWASVDGASSYNIQFDDGYGWTSGGSTPNNEHTVSGLQPYTNYSFRVQAVGSSNISEWSSSKSARTWIGKPLVLTRTSGTSVTLIITPVDGAASYSVNYGTTPDFSSAKHFTNAQPVNGSIPDVKIPGLTAGKTYYFFVMPISSGTSQAEYAMISVSL